MPPAGPTAKALPRPRSGDLVPPLSSEQRRVPLDREEAAEREVLRHDRRLRAIVLGRTTRQRFVGWRRTAAGAFRSRSWSGTLMRLASRTLSSAE